MKPWDKRTLREVIKRVKNVKTSGNVKFGGLSVPVGSIYVQSYIIMELEGMMYGHLKPRDFKGGEAK